MECTVRNGSFESPQAAPPAAVPSPSTSLMDNLVAAEKLAQSTQSRSMDGGGVLLPQDDKTKKTSSSSSACDVSLTSMLASLSQLSMGGNQELNLPLSVNPMLTAVPGFCWSGSVQPDDHVAQFNQSAYQNFPMIGATSSGISLDQLHQQPSTSQWTSQAALGYTAQPLPPGGSSRTYPGWGSTSQLTLSVLARNGLGTRGSVNQGRSMSVQNVNVTNDPQSVRAPQGYSSSGISLAPLLAKQCSDRMAQESNRLERVGEASRISLIGGLSQLQDPNAAVFDAQWLDLIRIAANKESTKGIFQSDPLNTGKALDPNNWTLAQSDGRIANKGRLPIGFLDNNLMRGDSYLLDQFTARKLCFPSKSGLGSQPALNRVESYSRKVFVGGLPPDIDEDEIMAAFRHLGPLVVDWPHKSESKSYFPPKGYCFLLFQDELSVQALVDACFVEDGKLYWRVSSPTMKDKPVQIRPWNLADSDYVMDSTQPLDPRKTVFVGGVPRPLRAVELAIIMARLYGGVCYAGIDTDPELKYPKGAGRVSFSSQQSYIAAISARFVQLQLGDIDKRVEVKPYVLDDQICDECQGLHSAGKFAPFFCANVMCLQYYCEHCWSLIHSSPNREFHKPLVKEGADRPRALPFRWC